MPDFDLDAALTWANPLAEAPIYLRGTNRRVIGVTPESYEVYAKHAKFYHYLGSLEEVNHHYGTFECQSPFEVHPCELTMSEGIKHLVEVAGKFMAANPDRFWKGRKSRLVNAQRYARL